MVQVNRDQSQPAGQEKKEEVEAMEGEGEVSEPRGDPEVAPRLRQTAAPCVHSRVHQYHAALCQVRQLCQYMRFFSVAEF